MISIIVMGRHMGIVRCGMGGKVRPASHVMMTDGLGPTLILIVISLGAGLLPQSRLTSS